MKQDTPPQAIDWTRVESGTDFECDYEGKRHRGKIQIENCGIYLCQNFINGAFCNDKFGFDYSFFLYPDVSKDYLDLEGITNLILLPEQSDPTPLTAEDVEPYLKHLPTCNIMQDWSEAEMAMADTPESYRDHDWAEALNEMNRKKTTCTCGLARIRTALEHLNQLKP